MTMEPRIARRIVRNALLSLFLYALPILLMFATFYLTGQRPWVRHRRLAIAIEPAPTNQLSITKTTLP